ncbi:hypothetical protein [uncultured Azohydromonas sp.]|uniref:hypothetical protein n=1 Tax=uncultured Azohydromonas sp. TaxID=487342 RepID=UPI0026322F7B|nr:hypothetical protein [uncultured Azohydromonas sp.]
MSIAIIDSCATDAPATPAAPEALATTLRIEGWVRKPLELDAAALDAMDGTLVQDFDVICTWDGSHGVLPPVRAVFLGDLIMRAHPAFEQRVDYKRTALVAEGRGGYRALYSWGEVFNSPLGRGIVVAYAQDGSALPLDKGTFVLFSRHDVATGPRYVQGLRRIELVKVW